MELSSQPKRVFTVTGKLVLLITAFVLQPEPPAGLLPATAIQRPAETGQVHRPLQSPGFDHRAGSVAVAPVPRALTRTSELTVAAGTPGRDRTRLRRESA